MKHIYKIGFFLMLACLLPASNVSAYCCAPPGYTCTKYLDTVIDNWVHTCTKSITTYTTTYDTSTVHDYWSYHANKIDYNTIYGYRTEHFKTVTTSNTTSNTTTDTKTYYTPGPPTPLIYLENMPEGSVSVTLDSVLNQYYPDPVFNQENGWVLNGADGVAFEEDEDELFYRLELDEITFGRGGMNFESKDAIIDYLIHSDFLEKLGFTEREQENSLAHLIPDVLNAEDTNYYYLTVLDQEAIEEISTITIEPSPEKVTRKYFAVLPTQVAVRTTGTFEFPEPAPTDTETFTATETGELLINGNTFVTFK